MSLFTFTDLPLPGLVLVQKTKIEDQRGFLSRVFCNKELSNAGWQDTVAQVNFTHTSKRGTVRGLHFQHPPHSEMKLVNCLRGEVWDVVIDIRAHSPTFLKWHAQILSENNGHGLLIPKGFAHGFQTLSDNVDMLYCHSSAYTPISEAGLNPNDEKLVIPWPLTITDLSERDRQHPLITPLFTGINP